MLLFIDVNYSNTISDVQPLNYEMVDFHSDRPGHDLRYGLDGAMTAEMGWKLPLLFEQSLRKTIMWTLQNQEWLIWN